MNAFTFGDQAFLARAGTDWNPILPMTFPGLWRWYRADSYASAVNMQSIGGNANTWGPWKDESGQFEDGGASVATQVGPSQVVNISGGAFAFTAAHVGLVIRINTPGYRNAIITARNSASQIVVDQTQAFVGSASFGIYDDAHHPTGPLFRTDKSFAPQPCIDIPGGFLNFHPGGLDDFTLIAVNRKSGTSSFIVGDSYVANHQIRRSYSGDNTTLFYRGVGVAASAFGAVNSPQALTVRRSGAAVTFWENKTARGGGNDAGTWTPREIGSAAVGGFNEMAELLIWKGTVLSDAQVTRIYNEYLKPRWPVLP